MDMENGYKFKKGDKVMFAFDKKHSSNLSAREMKVKDFVNDGCYLPNGKEINKSGETMYVLTALSGMFSGIDFVGRESELELVE